MSKLLSGSICLTDLISLAKQQHSSFNKAQSNGKIYCNINIWLNDQPDKFDNNASIQVNPKKDSSDEKNYIGNAHYIEFSKPAELTPADAAEIDDNLPF